MKTIKDIMTPNCTWVSPETTIVDAAKKMRDQDIGFLAVGENDRLIGTLTDRDVATRVVAANKDAAELCVRDVMSKKLYYCFDDLDADAVAQNMAAMQVKRFPVVNRAKRLVGTVSFADLATAASAQTFTNAQKQISARSSCGKTACGCASNAA